MRFADLLGELADRLDPLLAEPVHPPLQLRDDVALDRVERDRRCPQDRVLDEHEDDDGQQRAQPVAEGASQNQLEDEHSGKEGCNPDNSGVDRDGARNVITPQCEC